MPANPSLFRKMSEPHESRESLTASLEQFFDDVTAARERAQLKNVAVVIASGLVSGAGELETHSIFTLGDESAAEGMFAYGFGVMKVKREELIGSLLKGKK